VVKGVGFAIKRSRVQLLATTLSGNNLFASVTRRYKLVEALQGVAEVTADLVESNGSLPPGLWRLSLHLTYGLTACTPGSAPGPTLGNEYGRTLPFYLTCLLAV